MPKTLVTCPSCGPVRPAAEELRILEVLERQAIVCLDCPGCGATLVRSVDISRLQRRTTPTSRPTAVVAHPEPHDAAAPPLTVDDVLDGILLLRRDDWFERLLTT